EHGSGRGGRTVTVRRPSVERKDRRDDPEAEKKKREPYFLELGAEPGFRQIPQDADVKGMDVRREIHGDEPDQHKGRTGQQHQGQFHGRVLFTARTPDPHQQIHGQNREFVKEEEKEQVQAFIGARDPADQERKEDVIFLLSETDVPGDQGAGEVDTGHEQDHQGAHPIHAQEIFDPEVVEPRHFLHQLKTAGRDLVHGKNLEGDPQFEGGHKKADPSRPFLGRRHDGESREDRNDDEGRKNRKRVRALGRIVEKTKIGDRERGQYGGDDREHSLFPPGFRNSPADKSRRRRRKRPKRNSGHI